MSGQRSIGSRPFWLDSFTKELLHMSPRAPETDFRTLRQSLETEKITVSTDQLHLKALSSLQKSRRDMAARLVFAVMAALFSVLVIINTSFSSARLASVRIVAAIVALALVTNAI